MMDFVLVEDDEELLARRKRFPRKEKKPLWPSTLVTKKLLTISIRKKYQCIFEIID